MKLTKQQVKEIRKSKKVPRKQLAQEYNVALSTINYYVNDETRKKTIKRAKEKYKKLSKKEKKERSKKNYHFQKKYYQNRYETDPKFREIIRKKNRENKRRRYKKAIKEGLCPRCLGKRDSKFKQCLKCREKRRK